MNDPTVSDLPIPSHFGFLQDTAFWFSSNYKYFKAGVGLSLMGYGAYIIIQAM